MVARAKPATPEEEHAQKLITAQQMMTRLDAGPDKSVSQLDPKFKCWHPYRVAKPHTPVGRSQINWLKNIGYVPANSEAHMPALAGGQIWVCPPRQHAEWKKFQALMAHQAHLDVNRHAKQRIQDTMHSTFGDRVGAEVEIKETQAQMVKTGEPA